MKPAPCSCRVRTSLILSDRDSESRKSRFSSPGTPKMYSQPSASRHSMNRSDAFCCSPPSAIGRLPKSVAKRGGYQTRAGESPLAFTRPCPHPAGVTLDAPHLVIDGFLAATEHAALLEQTLRL